jgi:uncharacterized protein YkwD
VRSLWLAAVLACVALLCGNAQAADDPYSALLAPAGTCGSAEQLGLDPATAQATMLCLTNYARAQSGLSPLSLSTTLNAAGSAKLGADVSCGVFSHEPCGQPFDSVFSTYTHGATSYQIGENIAWGTGSFGTPRSIMAAWLHSSGHRANILTPAFKELGIGYLSNQAFLGYSGAALWSQQFGMRTPVADAASAPASATAKPIAKKHKGLHAKRLAHRR